jgi:hypothetical protein
MSAVAEQRSPSALAREKRLRLAAKREQELLDAWNARGGVNVYVSGPMSGYPRLNRPAFAEAAEFLTKLWPKAIIASPGALPSLSTWKANLVRDVRDFVVSADIVVTLPGWRKSKGARLECHIAKELGIQIVSLHALREAK